MTSRLAAAIVVLEDSGLEALSQRWAEASLCFRWFKPSLWNVSVTGWHQDSSVWPVHCFCPSLSVQSHAGATHGH